MPEKEVVVRRKALTIASNLAYVIPWAVATVVGDLLLTAVLPIMIAASTLFHIFKPFGLVAWSKQKTSDIQLVLEYIDTALALVIIIHTFMLFWQKDLPLIFWLLVPAVTFAAHVFQFWRKEYYEEAHALWHITAAFTITAALI